MKNKIDFNGQTVTIPLEELIKTAENAVAKNREAVETVFGKISVGFRDEYKRGNDKDNDKEYIEYRMFIKMRLDAERLMQYTVDLEQSIGVLFALREATRRDTLIIEK